MRTNLPVTQNEVMLRDDSMIVSKTDLKGRITYVNKDFLEISGFTEAELIGEPHNIVRHPDMPIEAFKDLWVVLQAGRPWVGYVKNRCKNGDYYWVEAHASPIWEGNQVVGYMSVRRKPPRDKVEAAEKAYALFREKRQGSLIIRDGWVASKTPLGRFKEWLKHASVSTKLMLSVVIISVLFMSGGGMALSSHIKDALEKQGVYELQQNLRLIYDMVEVRAAAMQKEADRLMDVFAANFPEGFTVEGGENSVLRHGQTNMYQRATEVDQFTASTSALASIFMRKGDDFVRIATSQKDEKGQRPIGSTMAKDHPARARLLAGKRFEGLAKIFNKDHYTAYAPIQAKDGKVIGAIGIALDVSEELAVLKKRIREVKVSQSGYFYVLDDRPGPERGTLIVHPAKEGTNLYGAKDASGREFIREMHERQQGTIVYPWMNKELGDTAARDKVVAFDTFKEWHWLIGGGTYVDEFYALSRSVNLYMSITMAIILLALMAVIYWLVSRLVQGPLHDQVLPAFKALSGGKYDNAVEAARDDEIGKVLQGLESMQNRLGFEVAETKRMATENLRIVTGLDKASVAVTVSDHDNTLIFMNEQAKVLWSQMEAGIKVRISDFDATKMIGGKLAAYFEDQAVQAAFREEFSAPREFEMVMSGRHLHLASAPIYGTNGEYVGRVTEWRDRTVEVAAEREIEQIVQAALIGDYSPRIDLAGKTGFFAALGEGLNEVLDTTAKALTTTSEVLSKVAQGDLSQTIEAEYSGIFGQLKDDTNTTVERLREVVGRIKEATEAINTAAQEIAAGNQDLSSRTEEQASSLEETASSMEELNATVRNNAESARQANQLATSSNEIASRGGQMVKQVVHTMTGIQASSQKIADIVGVIDSIAFQTNILALNAAVEAARAGEQGRGFAVVASEVRNLAQRSATAAKEIKLLITESVDKVEGGVQLVNEAGNTMDEVVTSFQQVTRLVQDITEASREQSSGIEQVTQAVSQMDEVTQQNAALVEEAAAAAESLEDQARSLVQAVGMFKLSEGTANVPGPALRDATPKQLGEKLAQARLVKPTKQIPPPHLADNEDEDEWAEF